MIHRYGLISDTHGNLHPQVLDLFGGVEAIFHAGDVVGERVLDELEAIAPTWAVLGNCDLMGPRLPALRVVQAAFGKVIITHSHLLQAGMGHPKTFVRHFAGQKPRLILFGHTHQRYQALHDGVWVVNPGSAGKPDRRGEPSVALLDWDSERQEFTFDFVALDWSAGGIP